MVQAAIHPETGEFLGLIVPKADLDGRTLTVYGTAEAWARLAKGETLPTYEVGVVVTPKEIENVLVDNLFPPDEQSKGGN
jgi:polynucleotide 5'-kinase involved in rRNA processing